MTLSLLASLTAAALVAAKDVVSKKVSTRVHPLVSSFASFLFATPFYVLILVLLFSLGFEDFSWKSGFWFYVLLRALSDTAAESGRMLALQRGELSSVGAVIALHPLITLLISPWITGDILSPNIIWGVVLATFGSYLFTRVPVKLDIKTFLISLGTAVFFSLNNCFDRLSALSASATLSSFAMNSLAAILTLPFALKAVGYKSGLSELKGTYRPFLLRGSFEAIFMIIKLFAMSTLQAPVVSAILRLSLVFQVAAGRTLFKEEGLVYRISGSIFIIAGSILTLQS